MQGKANAGRMKSCRKLSDTLDERFSDPKHVANAVLYAVSQPTEINIADITVRPPRH